MKPAILLLDIETFPLLSYTWDYWETNVLAIKEPSIVCCFSAKWLGGEHITKALPDYKGYKADKRNDLSLLKELWSLLDKADVICAHNGDGFDIKRINARSIAHGFNPPAPYKTVDTRKIARRVFGFPSNSLNELCQYLGIGKKMATGGFELWQGCMAGDKDAWAKMKAYNHNDVLLLEGLYNKLLPWINNHPNRNVYTLEDGCPKCGSALLQSRGTSVTATCIYRRFQCTACGGWGKSTKSINRIGIRHA